jgi:hypothetical protein
LKVIVFLPSPLSHSSEAHNDRITIRDQSDAKENNKRNVSRRIRSISFQQHTLQETKPAAVASNEIKSMLEVCRPASALVAQSDGAVTVPGKERPTEARYRSLSAYPPGPHLLPWHINSGTNESLL